MYKDKKGRAYLQGVHKSFVKKAFKKGGKFSHYNIGIVFPESDTGIGNIAVNYLMPAYKFQDGKKTQEEDPDRFNVILDANMTVSYKKDGEYVKEKHSCEEIVSWHDEAKKLRMETYEKAMMD